MKMKGLFFGMLAFWSLVFVGCSDDVIEGPDNGQEQQIAKGTGYFSVSFSAGTNSSRGVTDNADGDKDGSAEDSGHHNQGKDGESTVNSILVVLKGEKNEHYAYFNSGKLIEAAFDNKTNGQEYIMNKPLRVNLDTYKVLVVVNPASTIVASLSGITNDQQAGTAVLGTTSLYETICGMEIKAENNESFDVVVGKVIAKTTDDKFTVTENPTPENANFMMTNQEEEAGVKVDLNNTPENPAVADINVERVVSKITFRSNATRTSEGALTEADKTNIQSIEGKSGLSSFDYWYRVPFKQFAKVQESAKATLNNKETNFAKYKYTFEDEEVIVWKNLDDATDVEWYTIESSTATKNTDVPTDAVLTAVSVYETDENGNIKYTEETWYVELTDYALINLSNRVYAIRHIGTEGYTNETGITVMGKLDATNEYLVDPWSVAKNNLNLTEGGNVNWSTATQSYFYQTWADVVAETEKTSGQQYFKSFSSVTSEQGTADAKHNNIENVGNLLSYCFENAVKADHQVLGLSTGIVFKAKMYAKNGGSYGAVNTPLFSYEGVAYKSLQAMTEILGSVVNSVEGVTTKDEKNWTDADIIAFEKANPEISVYKGGSCYYYTSQIKHFDDGIPTETGVMEFAIMRNNIYSLAVDEISQIGDATLDVLEPETPDEEPTANIKVHARILPWIVRFTNIQF